MAPGDPKQPRAYGTGLRCPGHVDYMHFAHLTVESSGYGSCSTLVFNYKKKKPANQIDSKTSDIDNHLLVRNAADITLRYNTTIVSSPRVKTQ